MNNKRAAFVKHYLQCFNATEAARRAGYKDSGAAAVGCRLLKVEEIKAAIAEAMDQLSMSSDEVLLQLTAIARGTPEAFISSSGGESWKIDIPKLIQNGNLGLIKSIRKDRYGLVVEMHDRLQALNLLAKARKLYDDDSSRVQVIDFGPVMELLEATYAKESKDADSSAND